MTPLHPGGTRFRLFPSYAEGYVEPEVVEVSLPPGMISIGPADPSMYVVIPLDKAEPYDPPSYGPPYRAAAHPPAIPTPDGQFDQIPVETEQFLGAHIYGCVRRTLDVWEHYLNRRVVWWDVDIHPQLELVTMVQWPNAQSGPGFLETGRKFDHDGRMAPFCLNFDVMAHETGHAVLFSQIGLPRPGAVSVPFLSFHESFSDLVALISVLHFHSVCTRLLEQTDGNLYVLNLVNRIGVISDTEQIRLADNTTTMGEVAGITLAPDGSWIDPFGENRNQHAVGEPLTGAIFDILVEIYQDGLASRRLIAPNSDPRGWTRDEVYDAMGPIQTESASAFARFARGFYASLANARDVVGHCMAHVMLTVHPETLTFGLVAARFLEAAAAHGQAPILPELLDHFLWRGIDPRPFLSIAIAPRLRRHHGKEVGRLWVSEAPNASPYRACCDARAYWYARRLMPHLHRERPGRSF